MSVMGLLDRERTVAPPGFNRWLIPPAALAVHLCIGEIYGFSVFNEPLTRLVGVSRSIEGRDWTIRFILPKALAREEIPEPGRGVTIADLPARTVAVLRFGGRADDKLMTAKEGELRAWLEEHGIEATGPIEHAFYDSPIMPGPLRQNEVMAPIAEA